MGIILKQQQQLRDMMDKFTQNQSIERRQLLNQTFNMDSIPQVKPVIKLEEEEQQQSPNNKNAKIQRLQTEIMSIAKEIDEENIELKIKQNAITLQQAFNRGIVLTETQVQDNDPEILTRVDLQRQVQKDIIQLKESVKNHLTSIMDKGLNI